MGIYYVFILCFSMLCLLNYNRINEQQKDFLLFYICIALALMAGLRYDDPDYSNYVELFDEMKQGNFFATKDFGFNVIAYVVIKLTSNPVCVFLVVATIAIVLNINSFSKYTPFVMVCILLYFVHNFALKEMIQIRGGLACSVCLFSFRYLSDNKYKYVLLCWFIAVLLHMSVLLFGFVILFHRLKFSPKLLGIMLVVSFLIGTFMPLGTILKQVVLEYSFGGRLESYTLYGDSGYGKALGIWTNLNTIKVLIICLLCFYFYNPLKDKSPYFPSLFISYVIGASWLLCFNDFEIIGARMSNILLCVEPILLSYSLYLFKSSSRPFIIILLIAFSLVNFRINIAPNKITPYRNYIIEEVL